MELYNAGVKCDNKHYRIYTSLHYQVQQVQTHHIHWDVKCCEFGNLKDFSLHVTVTAANGPELRLVGEVSVGSGRQVDQCVKK